MKIFLLLLLFLGCIPASKENMSNNSTKAEQDTVTTRATVQGQQNLINTIKILLNAGFFQRYTGLSPQKLLEKLNQDRLDQHLILLGRDTNYIPDPLTILEILEMDDTKFLSIDLEANVCKENQVYLSLLKILSKASAGNFQPSNKSEVWTTEHGPIHISFNSKGKTISFTAEYMNDWIDTRFFELINNNMENSDDIRFWGCSGPNGEWLDQTLKLVQLSTAEKNLLEKNLGWSFYSLSSKVN